MNRRVVSIGVVTVIGAALGYSLSRITPLAPPAELSSVQYLRLKRAMLSLEADLGSLDSGPPTLTEAVTQAAQKFNQTSHIDPEELRDLRAAGIAHPASIPVTLWQPKGPWQLVVIPDDVYHIIRVEAYGVDLSHPLLSDDITPNR